LTQESCYHDHNGATNHLEHEKRDEKIRLKWVIALTGATAVLEAVFGWLSGSLALLSDAAHMLTHFGALLISLAAIYIARRPSPPERTYGLFRIEILAALFNVLTLIAFTLFILWEAVQRFLHPEPIATLEMFIIALIGLAVNFVSAGILWKVGHGQDLNVRSAFLHLLGDTVSSVAVVVGALLIRYTGGLWIDPLLSVLICGLILVWAFDLTRQSVSILLESTPRGISLEKVGEALSRVDGVIQVHDLHIWSITSGMNALTAHIEVPDQPLSAIQSIRRHLEKVLSQEFSIRHTNFQFEVASPEGKRNCREQTEVHHDES
jgi:cobalt-zinc-cadmium efflux system protein